MEGKISNIWAITMVVFLIGGCSCWETDEVGVVPCQTDNCTTCDQTSTNCIACADGFFLDDAVSLCSPCDSQIFNCISCTLDSSATPSLTCDACFGD